MPSLVHYLPIATTLIALPFAAAVLVRWRRRGGPHLLWWSIGLVAYGAGTAVEAATTLFGWHQALFKAWYITGALLGGAPLAQGTVYLLLSRRTANRLTAALLTLVAVAAVCVLLAPVNTELVEAHRLTGRVLSWRWVRFFSPFINLYAFVFLVGGATLSAVRYARAPAERHRFLGNAAIAVGALLPGIGGSATRFGHTEVLYVTELIGLVLIWAGYRVITGGIERKPVETSQVTQRLAT
ncbi:MAG: hypothetical protein ACREMW_07215 [Gemmatimonadales bacterium]